MSAHAQNSLVFPSQGSYSPQNTAENMIQYDREKNCASDQHTPTDFKTYLTHFACGHVSVLQNGTVVRKFTLIADDYHGVGAPVKISLNKTDPVIFHAWMFNGSIPGPTMRMTQGDHVQITVYNSKDSSFIHSFHMHSPALYGQNSNVSDTHIVSRPLTGKLIYSTP